MFNMKVNSRPNTPTFCAKQYACLGQQHLLSLKNFEKVTLKNIKLASCYKKREWFQNVILQIQFFDIRTNFNNEAERW